MVEFCTKANGKKFLHPIIDWSVDEVWQYIHQNKMPYCSLYDEGFKRIGCVLCPMETPRQTQIELERFPKIARAWRLALEDYYNLGRESVHRWSSAEEMWQWWLSRKGQSKNDGQCSMFI
jgi:phosphoadenosine phosphosulfate reductase